MPLYPVPSAGRVQVRVRRRPTAPVALVLLAAGACAPAYSGWTTPSPDRIPQLERDLRARPSDLGAMVQLGAAYRAADRPGDAVPVLERARQVAPDEAAPVLLLGLAYEDLERWSDARALYQGWLEVAPDHEAAGRVRERIALVRRSELRQAVARAVEREAELDAAPAPTTIAVFPFAWEGSDPELEPLRFAVAGMIATDLAQVERFTLLERMHVDALVAEVRLGESGLVDPATAARGGRLLGAGRVVQGRLAGSEAAFDLDAAVVALGAGQAEVRPVETTESLERFFEMEKQVVLGLFDAMGVTLTAAERERVMQRGTGNLQALVAYGRGLEASADGDFREAARQFQRATEIDPSFQQAEAEAQEAESMASAESAEPEAMLRGEDLGRPVAPDPVDLSDVAAGAATRDPAAEVTRTEGVTRATDLVIIIRRPGGGQ